MSLSTKRGDGGETSLIGGRRVSKNHPRVRAYGTVDEFTSALGLCRAHCQDAATADFIRSVQINLIYLMGELASETPDGESPHAIKAPHVEELTEKVKQLEQNSGSFKGWVIPGDNIAQGFFDLARTTCRRAEREIVGLKDAGSAVRPEILHYLNRLSDLLWLLGRAQLNSK
jgi:cob(I)alamin adenosyltransferase